MGRLRDMELFVRIVEAGSFSAAARDLNMGQPAVSKTIAGLEERLGVRLLVRSTRRLSPTEAGLAFYERALHAIAEANEAEAAARGSGQDWRAGCGSGRRLLSPGYTLFPGSVNSWMPIQSLGWNL
jgi:DNA-binding transcriptional LysR family regulator